MSADGPTIIKKYANRRLYDTGTSTYVTLEELAKMVREGQDFVVHDARTGEDITRSVLGQIIFELESRGDYLLPIAFLRQLIRFYGDSMQALVPTYLEASLASFARNQEELRQHMAGALKGGPLGLMEEQARRNMEMFAEAMRMWAPFAPGAGMAPPRPDPTDRERERELQALREQLKQMQKTLETIAKKG